MTVDNDNNHYHMGIVGSLEIQRGLDDEPLLESAGQHLTDTFHCAGKEGEVLQNQAGYQVVGGQRITPLHYLGTPR